MNGAFAMWPESKALSPEAQQLVDVGFEVKFALHVVELKELAALGRLVREVGLEEEVRRRAVVA